MAEIESVRDSRSLELHHGGESGNGRPGIAAYVGSVALVGLGAALIEGELLAGMALGVAAMAIPGLAPKLGTAFRPLLKSAVRATYGAAAKTRETVAEMGEQFQDIVAEVRAEGEDKGTPPASGAQTPEEPVSASAEPAAEPEQTRSRRSGRTQPATEEQ
jgi:hypothetical protein